MSKNEFEFEELLLHNWTIDELSYMHRTVMHPSYQDGKDPTPRDLPNMYSQEMQKREKPTDDLWYDGWESEEGHA